MEKGKQKALLVKMNAEMHKLLKIKATEQGINMTAVVLSLIQNYLSTPETVDKGAEVAFEKK